MQDFKDFHPGNNTALKADPRGKKPVWIIALLAVTLIAVLALYALSDPSPYLKVDESTTADSLAPGAQASVTTSNLRWLVEPFISLDKVQSGDTFETLLQRNGIDYERMVALLKCARPLYNLNRVITGREVKFIFEREKLCRLEYEIDPDRTLCLSRSDSLEEDEWNAQVVETEYQVHEREISGTIESSLYETVMDVYGNPDLALRLSEIYAWQIDFHNEVQKGDRFKVLFEEKVHPKGMTQVGEIYAAVYEAQTKSYYAIEFTNKDGTRDYFDLDGLSMRRKFLRVPFKYMPRISSRFSYSRFHPILKIRRPHLGVDYAAASGTPVLALGDGKVTYAGRNGGFGNYIQIKHNGMFTTGYGHLSRFAIKRGSFVHQGQVIGYVGQTGLATGPHLDFRFFRNGSPVDPLKVDLPAGDPVNKSLLSAFNSLRDSMVQRLQRIGSPYGPPEPSIAYGQNAANPPGKDTDE